LIGEGDFPMIEAKSQSGETGAGETGKAGEINLDSRFRGLLESAPDGIVVVDNSGLIVIVNSQTEVLFGYTRDELIGRSIEILVPNRVKVNHVKYRNDYIHTPVIRPMGAGLALTGRKKNGEEFPVEISLSPLEVEKGVLIISIIRDITERRRAEEELKNSLREKESLLREIHHRVKNNLQVTSSLLRLQSDYVHDEHDRRLFTESQNRIRSMALVHEKLYRSSDLSRINFSEYIDSLAILLFRSYGVNPAQIQLKSGGGQVYLSIESAVPCGLIVNELLSNSLKHAFPSGQKGIIEVYVSGDDSARVEIQLSDDGIGLPPGMDLEKLETLGLQLVRTLVKQLDGKLEVKSGPGTQYNISFLEIKRI
jgi:PAS domain S-box-containing protein